ncbi:hypothetical protein [Peterkaempfera sp. SMS 1(5)a]|uniref:hypothetical protein n=1 Tax=Peterkaempfera podocarpi TaxID=3232308 RepID=UPI003671A4E5
MRTTRLLIGTLVCAAAVAGLTGCTSDKKGDSASAPASGSASASSSLSASPSPSPSASSEQTPGIETLSAKQISDKAKAALLAAPSLTMDVVSTSGGDQVRGKVSLDRKGHCIARMTMGSQGSMVVLESGGQVWIKPDEVFLKGMAGAEGAKLMAGKYLKGASVKDMASLCDLDEFAKGITQGGSSKAAKAGVATVGGQRTAVIKVSEDGGMTTIYVAAEGTPYPVKMVHTGSDSGTVLFSGFGEPVNVTVPPASLVIDSSKL